MVVQSLTKMNPEIHIENKIIFYIVYLIIIDIILALLKIGILERVKNIKNIENIYYYFSLNNIRRIFPFNQNSHLKTKNKSTMILIINRNKKTYYYNNIKNVQLIKRKNNNIKYKNIFIRNYILIISLIKFVIVNNYCHVNCKKLFDLFNFKYSKITLKVKGIGDNTLFGNETNYNFNNIKFLKEIKINGNIQVKKEYIYHFEQVDNFVELIWEDTLYICDNMFRKCSNITEIDLSNFNTSTATSMNFMFFGCSSLTSLNLSNFNTSSVISMNYMFDGCSTLTSLNLSNFNTSKVISMYNMFNNCSSLSSLNLSNFNTSIVKSMNSMFGGCSSLTSLNLCNFNTSLISSFYFMFKGCSSLTSLNLANFNTSKVTTMQNMFYGCSSLTSLNLSNFNTSSVTSMSNMFDGCSSLTSLNLSNFNTSKVTYMKYMFNGCSSLTSLNLSNFNTSKVTYMNNMFNGCSSLTSLNLSNFDTSSVINIRDMFNGCVNLEYINLNNFDEKALRDSQSNYINMFYNISKNVVICIEKSITQSKIFPQIENLTCYTIDCTDNWKSRQKKIIKNTDQCIESCNNSSIYPYEYNGKCYDNCSNGFLYDRINRCKCELDECLLCPNVALNKGLCTKCNINYYPKENDPSNIGEYIKCYKELEGYYLDVNLYRQCYYKCKTCNILGNNDNHNCLECNNNYPIGIKHNNYMNCYIKCKYYYYFDKENNYHCTTDLNCPNEYNKLNIDKKECMKIEKKMSKDEEIEYYDNLIKNIEKIF